jgi:RNase H-fold protein (predicted Holliday junction resolvase)
MRSDGGAANILTEQCERFGKLLETRSKVSVSFVREAWSSFEAARFAPDQKKRDDAAAAIILQRFLDAKPKAS